MYKKIIAMLLLTLLVLTQPGISASSVKAADDICPQKCPHTTFKIHNEYVNGWNTTVITSAGQCIESHRVTRTVVYCANCGYIRSQVDTDEIIAHSNPNCPNR